VPEKTSDIWWLFSRQTVSITTKETVLNAAVLMKNRNFRHLPILSESGKILGILSVQDIIDSLNLTLQASTSAEDVKRSMEIPVERIMTGQPVAVEPGDGLKEVIKKFSFYNVGALPVVGMTGVVEGIITLRDLVSLMGTSSSPMNVPVSEIMSNNVVTLDPASSLAEAVRLMSERRIRRLPVLSAQRVPAGVVTNKDVLRYTVKVASAGANSPGFDRPVEELMSADLITIGAEDDVRAAANLMTTFGVGGLIVSGLPMNRIALVTERDLIRSLSSTRGVDFLVNSMQYELEAEDAMSRIRSHTAR
jgi:CBS domain-containing protein